ncbi:hypothetical protein GKC56_02115 [Neisseriaceae bacterium PsAf]|nr:hypothetical protein [Neisseriaceae bacterium PsAf]
MSQYLNSSVEIVAVLISAANGEAKVLTLNQGEELPHGPLDIDNPSLQKSVRQWVYRQTNHPLGYVEQLYTFIDKNYYHLLVGYLGLVKEQEKETLQAASWINWYVYFPWEDHRIQRPEWINQKLVPLLEKWLTKAKNEYELQQRQHRINLCWGINGYEWNEEYVLQRYELLYEANLVPESPYYQEMLSIKYTGKRMMHDYRRILATAVARLRAKIKYRPVVFELMPETFTLLSLQECVEALSGISLHKQNFRRLINKQNLIEPMQGEMLQVNRGRPAQLFKFKENILLEREIMGSKLPQLPNK